MRCISLLLLGLVALVAAQAEAQSMSVGPQVGYHKARDADKGALMGGAAWRIRLTPSLGVEASASYRHEKYADEILTVRSWPVMLTGMLYPLPVAYGAIGAGYYGLTYDYDQGRLPLFKDKTTHKMGWHFGGGVELPLGPRLKVTGDVRYVFLDYAFKSVPGTDGLKSDSMFITAGVLVNL